MFTPIIPANTTNVFSLGTMPLGNTSFGYTGNDEWGPNLDRYGNVIGAGRGASGPIIDIIPADRDIRPNSNRIGGAVKNKAKDLANDALDKGKEALNGAIRGAAKMVPGGEIALGVTDALGVTSECGWLCQLQEWIKETGIFQRLAIAILAFVFIAVALSMLGRNATPFGNIAKIVKGN